MTNLEYVKSQLTDRDVSVMMQPSSAYRSLASKSVMNRLWYAHDKWEVWHYPDGHTEKRGFSYILSVQQFLNLQYDPKWWTDE